VALQAREACERRVGGQADAVDPLLVGADEQRRDGADRGVRLQRRDEALEEVRPAVDVIVEQHDHAAGTRAGARVRGHRERPVLGQRDDLDLRKLARHRRARIVRRAVVDEDHAMDDRLAPQVLETARREVVAPVGGDDDVDGQDRGIVASARCPAGCATSASTSSTSSPGARAGWRSTPAS
jgi:hypothetical protein